LTKSPDFRISNHFSNIISLSSSEKESKKRPAAPRRV
jgi:hypothetical protein